MLRSLLKGSLLLLLSTTVEAQFLTSEGEAIVRHNDTSTARYMAIVEAMNQASLENGAEITSDTIMHNLAIHSDTVRIRTKGRVGDVHVLQEWQEDNIYHVRISAEISDAALSCNSPTALVHNKRIVVTQFINLATNDSSDLRDVESGLATMMVRSINNSSNKIKATPMTQYAIQGEGYAERAAQVQQLARQSGAQFILSGSLNQASRDSVGDLAESGLMKELSNFIGVVQEQYSPRHLEVETTLYDGESGEVIANQQDGITVSGKVYVGRDSKVGSHSFIATTTGSALQKLIDSQSRTLTNELACLPMTTTISSIKDNTITLPVGRNGGIHAGDRLVIVEQNSPLTILGILQITQVSATRSSGMTDIDPSILGITKSDLVRSW
ncbi:MAG: hypothetical protein HN963_07985 [Thiotrichales bacterium]|nr:hypothetical protein [Thiotrichales bacterium]